MQKESKSCMRPVLNGAHAVFYLFFTGRGSPKTGLSPAITPEFLKETPQRMILTCKSAIAASARSCLLYTSRCV